MAWLKLNKELFDNILLIEEESEEGSEYFLTDYHGVKYVGSPFKDKELNGFDCGGTNGWYLAFENVNLIWIGDLP